MPLGMKVLALGSLLASGCSYVVGQVVTDVYQTPGGQLAMEKCSLTLHTYPFMSYDNGTTLDSCHKERVQPRVKVQQHQESEED